MSDFEPALIPDGKFEFNGHIYMSDAKGGLQPVSTIKPQHLLEDEMTRKIMGFMVAASDQVSRLKEHTFNDIGEFDALLAQEYGLTKGGKKGNATYMTVDGLYKVQIAMQDRLDFGPEMQIAKQLVDGCLNKWAATANAALRTLVQDAFNTDKTGQISRHQIFMLLRQDVDDDDWKKAMEAIRNSIRVVGTVKYVRAYRRDAYNAPWEAVTVDMAKA